MSYMLAMNCGSSSLKYTIFDAETMQPIFNGLAERVGAEGSVLTQKDCSDGTKERNETVLKDHYDAVDTMAQMLRKAGINLDDIVAVGHRVVMGGDKFASSVEITDDVIETLKELSPLAPLHNPSGIAGIAAAKKFFPNAKHVAVFDTAFHQTMKPVAYRYPVPEEWYTVLGVRRYGFHGTSHLYVSKRAAAMLGKDASECNLITAHIGSGASIAAIKNGVCVDTSMGMTPTAGLVMGTRCGDIDPSIPAYVAERKGIKIETVQTELNKKSGLMGITKCFCDRRDIEANKDENDDCKLAIEMEAHNVKKYIGSYLAELGHVDALVFTAGVGENDDFLREKFCEGLEELGLKLDKEANKAALARKGVGETVISTPDSKIKIFMIPTDEERVILEDTLAILNGTYNPDHLKMAYSFASQRTR
ncbi:MAG: acetate kinase [Alphaproteobacteria bacterium]|nr:acetate kinase [Alphaproteobacteria bacterium]